MREKIRYWCHWLHEKIVREQATPEYIARGWAIGMFAGCLIPFGLQLAISIPMAFLLKGSKIGASVGTILTNHVTIFFIYPAQCYVGAKLLRLNDLTYSKVSQAIGAVLKEQSWDALLSQSIDIILAFFAGGVLLTLIMTPLTYFFVKHLVTLHRKRHPKGSPNDASLHAPDRGADHSTEQ